MLNWQHKLQIAITNPNDEIHKRKQQLMLNKSFVIFNI